jgi:hypothetical protein
MLRADVDRAIDEFEISRDSIGGHLCASLFLMVFDDELVTRKH